eukprot:CAMPEP_0202757430 /NCGR_PEP_ID=MMETSP1388-20130828/16363_1 /ASSEMBLY_ACC=CAM_ASM_000864 /TAXON_ID=37098 /ORGANISM="Isochrysis sp, Strain CCMP1244" /LENGTH=373 /DNA_ID=CAMNT_0049425321 /DNA_START=49 /DNA_END=1168 /DNA_ORIENTATION=+
MSPLKLPAGPGSASLALGGRRKLLARRGRGAHREPRGGAALLDSADRDRPAVKDGRGERRLDLRAAEDLAEVLGRAGARRGNHRDRDGRLEHRHERQVEAGVLPVAVDAVDEQLAGPERLHCARHLHDVEPRPLAAALQRALVPAERLAGGTASAAAERARVVGERVPLCGGGVRHPHAARVDRDDARLRAVLCGDGLDRGRAVARASALEVRAGSLRRVGAEGDLVRAGAEVGVGDLQRGRACSLRVDEVLDAASDAERDEAGARRLGEHFEHRQVRQRALAEARDVEESDLVCPLLVVPPRQRHRLAQVAHLAAALLAAVVLVALGHHEVARVVGAHVEAGDDAAARARGQLARAEPRPRATASGGGGGDR